MKICFKCGVEKHIDDFYKHKRMADGHLNKCKECTKNDTRRRSQIEELKPKIREAKRLWARSKRGKETTKARMLIGLSRTKSNEAKKRYAEKNKKKVNATSMVNNAVKYGFLIRPKECSVCNKYNKRIHGHHCDYDQPLDVIWMCPSCHSEWHRFNKPING